MARITKDSSLTEDQRMQVVTSALAKEGRVRGYNKKELGGFVRAGLRWWKNKKG
jgi:hypothetical protein